MIWYDIWSLNSLKYNIYQNKQGSLRFRLTWVTLVYQILNGLSCCCKSTLQFNQSVHAGAFGKYMTCPSPGQKAAHQHWTLWKLITRCTPIKKKYPRGHTFLRRLLRSARTRLQWYDIWALNIITIKTINVRQINMVLELRAICCCNPTVTVELPVYETHAGAFSTIICPTSPGPEAAHHHTCEYASLCFNTLCTSC